MKTKQQGVFLFNWTRTWNVILFISKYTYVLQLSLQIQQYSVQYIAPLQYQMEKKE